MKKFNYRSKLVTCMLGLAVLCGGCGSGSGYTAQSPNKGGSPTINIITPPSASVSAGSGSGIYVNSTTSQISVPSTSGYQQVAIPQSLATEIANSGSAARAFLQHNILFQVTNKNTYWIDLTNSSSSKVSSKDFTGNVINGSGIGNSSLYAFAVGATTIIKLNGTDITYSVLNNNSKNGVINYSTPTNSSGSFAISTTDTVNVCNVSAQKITAVQTAIFNGIAFLAIGTENGTVCLDNLDQTTGFPVSGNWQNISSQAAKKQNPGAYIPNPIASLGFYNSGNNLLGYWSLIDPNTSIISIYRVTGTFNGTDSGVPSNYLPQGFIDLGISQPQALLNGTPSLQIGLVPANITTNPAISMVNGNGELCTIIGSGFNNSQLQVYTFQATGSTNWSNPTEFLSGQSGFGAIAVQYGIDDQCTIVTSDGKNYSIS